MGTTNVDERVRPFLGERILLSKVSYEADDGSKRIRGLEQITPEGDCSSVC